MGPADAGALPQRPPGGCARDVPGGAARARRRAGARARAGAPAAAGGDPRARPRDRRGPGRPQAPRQSARAFDVVRRPRGRAPRGRRAPARAPPRDAHRSARRGQEPARGRDGTLARGRVPGRHLARRLRAGRRGGRRRPPPRRRRRRSRRRSARARDARGCETRKRSSSSTRASTCSTRQRGSRRRCSRSVPGHGSWRRAARHSTSRARRGVPVAPLEAAAVELFLERARAARPGFEPDAEAVALAAEIARRVDGLPLAIELAAARVNVLGLAELVSMLERRAALLRDSPTSDPARTALQGLVEWSYDLCTATRRRCSSSWPSTAAARPCRRSSRSQRAHDLNEATVAYLVAALVDKSIVSASFTGGAARYDMLDTRPRVRARASRRERRARRRPRRARRALRGIGRRGARRAARTGMAALGAPPRSWRTTTSGLHSRTRGTRAIPPSRFGSARWGGTSRWPTASPRDGASSSSPSLPRTTTRRSNCGSSSSPASATSRPRSSISTPRSRRAKRASRLPRPAAAPWQRGFAQLMLSLALAQSGDVERAAAMADDACRRVRGGRRRLGHRSEQPHSRDRCGARRRRHDRHRDGSVARRHSDAIGYDAFRAPVLLLEAWAAERRGEDAAAVDAYRRALELAGRIGFGDHAAFALAGLGAIALANGDLREAEELQRQALATAEAAQAPLGRGPRTRPARADRRGVRRRGRSRSPVPRGPRVVDDRNGRTRRARASSSRSPATRPRRQSAGSPSSPSPVRA